MASKKSQPAKPNYQGSLADYKKSVKPANKKSDGGSNLEDMKYTQKWYDAKIVEYSSMLAKAKVETPYIVKGIEEDISWLKNARRNAVKVAPSLPSGGGRGGRGAGGSPGNGSAGGGRGRFGGGLTNRGK